MAKASSDALTLFVEFRSKICNTSFTNWIVYSMFLVLSVLLIQSWTNQNFIWNVTRINTSSQNLSQTMCFFIKKSSLNFITCADSWRAWALQSVITLHKMFFFGDAHEPWERKRPPLPKICHIYTTTMKLGTAIRYQKKRRSKKIYKSLDTPSKFCWY